MTLAEKIGREAIHEHWPPELLIVVLDKLIASGVDLHKEPVVRDRKSVV